MTLKDFNVSGLPRGSRMTGRYYGRRRGCREHVATPVMGRYNYKYDR